MKTLETLSTINQLQMNYFGALMKQLDQPFLLDFTPRTLKVCSLRKEVLGKYASGDDGVYRFFFTSELIEEINRKAASSDNRDEFCIALYCEGSEQPCILTSAEWIEIISSLEVCNCLNLTLTIEKRSFRLTVVSDRGGVEKLISKKSSQKKLLN